MALVKPFCAVRAPRDKVALVSSRSYDAYSPAELGAQLNFNPFSFLHIISPSFSIKEEFSKERRFELIRNKYEEFKSLKHFIQDPSPTFYIYKKVTKRYSCIGIIAAASAMDYENNIIKKHEKTLDSREILFENYLRTVGFNAEPVLLTHPENKNIRSILNKYESKRAEYEFTTGNYKTHYLWLLNDLNDIKAIQEEFHKMHSIYIADGHHRSASSHLLAKNLRSENPNHTGNENYNFFMSYFISESDLMILEFNRLIKDLNGMTKQVFLNKLEEWYRIQNRGNTLYKPSKKHHFSMYLDGEFYSLYLKKDQFEIDNPLSDLDPQLLYETVLDPILGLKDLCDNKRIRYSHSDQGPIDLKNNVDSGDFEVAFGLFPISVAQLKKVADHGLKMPPKSTYILPKLRSGLTIYEI